MKKILLCFILLLIFVHIFSLNYLSPVWKYLYFEKVQKDTKYNLSDFIIENSVSVKSKDKELQQFIDYKMDYSKSVILFKKDFDSVTIKYLTLPKNLRKKFQNFFPTTVSDSLLNKMQRKKKKYYSTANLNISGSKTISFTLSNQNDITFDQTLFLKINGQLYKNMYIESQLSDNQTPITPEGNSKELSNLDKIYIRIYGKQYEFKFGDLEMDFRNTNFINYHPVFEGIKAKWFNNNYYEGALAISKGKTSKSTFYCTESKQGPYYLSTNNDKGIRIIPGSEELYLNGELLQRGIDYIIDYSEGSVTFTDKHFISSSSYVTVYFLYSDDYYKQNLYLFDNKTNIGNHIELYNYFIWEKDNKDNPLQQILSKDDIEILKEAGDQIAWGNGVSMAQEGNGEYKLSEDGEYYIYAPEDSLAKYNIHFTYVGNNNGNYTISENGEYYIYTGENQGDYIPKIKLVAPQNNLNYDVQINWYYDFLQLKGETIFTNHDKNSFSKKDNNDNFSNAFSISATINPDWDNIKPILKFAVLKKRKNLFTFAHINQNEILNQYMVLPDSISSLEKSVSLFVNPFNLVKIKTSHYFTDMKNYANSYRGTSTIIKQESKYIPQLSLSINNQKQNFTENLQKTYNSYQLDIRKKIKPFTLGYNMRKQILKSELSDQQSGFKDINQETFFSYKHKIFALKFSFLGSYKDTLSNNNFLKNNISNTFGLEGKLKKENNFLNFNLKHRIIIYPQEKSFDMANIILRNTYFNNGLIFNSSYKIDNLEFYPKIRELIKVSYGIYDSTGAIGGEGGYDWVVKYIDYDNPQKSTEITLSTTITLNPNNIIKKLPTNMQSESFVQLYENSTASHKQKLYLFNNSYFFNKTFSILSKKILRQTIWTDIIKNKLKLRMDYKINNTLDQRYQNSAENRSRIISEELTYKYSVPLSFKINFDKENKTESIYSSEFKSYNYSMSSFYRPNSYLILNSTLGYKIENASSILTNDNYLIKNIFLEENFTLFLKRRYRIFSKVKLSRVNKNSNFLDNINDKTAGYHLNGDININYKLNKYTSATFKYTVNLFSKAKDEHKISAEVKAEF